MKSILRKMVAVFCLLIAMVATVDAQNSFAYQAVIRSANGDLVSEKQVSLRFSLKYNDEVVYSETHKTTTNKYGSVQVKVGEGQKVSGDFAKVPWHTMQVMMQIEVDPAGGDSYNVNLGAIQLQPAPYAMHAASTGLVFDSSSPKSGSGALFEVKDKNGNPVFAVYPDGVRVYVDDADGKPIQTGFAVAGRRAAKDGEEANLFSVTSEGTRVTVGDSEDKPMATGFAVAGRRAAKDGESDLFTVSSAGTQIYLDTDANGKPMQTGFAVAGRRAAKDGENDKYLEINSDGTHVYIDDEGKPIQTGFAVAGRRAAKGSNDKYLEVTADGTKVYVDANGKPIQTGFAVAGRRAAKGKKLKLFEVNSYGTHIYIDEDADGDKPIQTGFAVAGRRAAKDGDHEKYVVIDADGTIIYVDYEEAKAMQTGFAVAGRRAAKDGSPNSILTVNNQDGTRVYIDDTDGKAMQTGFAVAGRRAAKDGEYIMQVTDKKASMLTQRLSIDDKQSSKSMMEMNTEGTAIKTENFVVAKEKENAAGVMEEVNVFQATPDQGVQIAPESKVVVKGDLAKAMEAEAIEATLQPISVSSEIKRVKCNEYAGILGEVDGYKLLKIRGNGLFTENQTFDNDGNAVIMFSMDGNITQNSQSAAVVVILTNPDSYDDAALIIWPCRQIDSLNINFGLMAEDSKGKYLDVDVRVESKAAVTNIELLSSDDDMGTVELDGTPAYNSIVSAVAKPKPGFEFAYWGVGNGEKEEWINEETGETEIYLRFDESRSSNPLYFFVGFETVKYTAVFYPIEIWFRTYPFEGGKVEVRQECNNNCVTTINGIEVKLDYITIGDPADEGSIPVAELPNGDSLIFVAIPEPGYKFAYWSMGWNDDERITDSVLNIKAEHSMEVMAFFEIIAETKPYGGKAAILPGVIEAENFDEGVGAYSNVTSGTSWQNYSSQPYAYDIPYRTDNNNEVGIDSVFAGGEYALSFTGGEWYDYTVHVDKAQQMRWAIRYANLYNENAQISITRDNEPVTGIVDAETTPGWWVYNMVSGETKSALPAGDYKLRLNFSDEGSNVDKIMFGNADDVLLSINIDKLGTPLEGDERWKPMGTVTGYGFYSKGDNATIKAVPDQGYRFVRWSDGVQTPEHTIEKLAGDTTIVAFFCKEDDEIKEDAKIQVMTNGEVEVKIDGLHHNPDDVPEQIVVDGVEYYIYTYSGDCYLNSSVSLLTTSDKKIKGWYGNYGDMNFSEFNVKTQTPAATNNYYNTTIGQTMNRFVALYEENVQQENDGKATIQIMTEGSVDLGLYIGDTGLTPEIEIDDIEGAYLYTYTCDAGATVRFKAPTQEGLVFKGLWKQGVDEEMSSLDDAVMEDLVSNYGEDFYLLDENTQEQLIKEATAQVVEDIYERYSIGGYEIKNNDIENIVFETEFDFEVPKGESVLIAIFAEEQPHQPTGAKIQVKTNGEVQFTVNGETVTSEPTTDDDDNYIYTLTCSLNDEVTFSTSGDYFGGWWLDCDEAEFFFSNHERGDESYWEDLDKYCVGGYVVDQDAQEIEGFKTEFTKTITADLLNADNVWALTAMFDGLPDTKVKYTVLDENTATCALTHVGVDYFNDERTSFDIPQAVDIKGKPYTVTAIGEYAFYGCSGLKSVTIPASVTTIGEDAFLDCGSMTSATFASVEALCTMTFENEHSNPMFPYDPAWNEDRYDVALYFGEEEKAFPSVEIPTTVNSVGQYAFINCRQLTSVNIPSNVKTLGNEAFARCVNLSSVTIAEGLQELGEKAFNECAFNTIVLPNTLTTIGDNAFDNCDNLVSVVIPESVTMMGKDVFSYIENNVAIFCLETDDDKNESRFAGWNNYWYEDSHEDYKESVVYEYRDEAPNIVRGDDGLLYFIYKTSNIDEDVLRNLTSANNFTAANGEAIVIGYRGDRADALNLTIPNELGDGSKALRSEVVAIARYAFRGESIASLTIGGDGSKAASTSSNLRFIGQGAFCNAGLRNLTINGDESDTWYRYNYDEGGEAIQVATMDANEMTTCSCGYEYFCEFGKSHTIYYEIYKSYEGDYHGKGTEVEPYNSTLHTRRAIASLAADENKPGLFTIVAMGSFGPDTVNALADQLDILLQTDNDNVKNSQIKIDFTKSMFSPMNKWEPTNGYFPESAFSRGYSSEKNESRDVALPNIVEVVLPDGISQIGANAFKNCSNLVMTVPACVKTIDTCAFKGCNMDNITFEDGEGWYKTTDGENFEEVTDDVFDFSERGTWYTKNTQCIEINMEYSELNEESGNVTFTFGEEYDGELSQVGVYVVISGSFDKQIKGTNYDLTIDEDSRTITISIIDMLGSNSYYFSFYANCENNDVDFTQSPLPQRLYYSCDESAFYVNEKEGEVVYVSDYTTAETLADELAEIIESISGKVKLEFIDNESSSYANNVYSLVMSVINDNVDEGTKVDLNFYSCDGNWLSEVESNTFSNLADGSKVTLSNSTKLIGSNAFGSAVEVVSYSFDGKWYKVNVDKTVSIEGREYSNADALGKALLENNIWDQASSCLEECDFDETINEGAVLVFKASE